MLKAAADTLADLIQKTADAIPLTIGPVSKTESESEIILGYQDNNVGITMFIRPTTSQSPRMVIYEVWGVHHRPSYNRDEPDDADVIVTLTTPSTVRAVEQLFMTYLEGRLGSTIRDLWESDEESPQLPD